MSTTSEQKQDSRPTAQHNCVGIIVGGQLALMLGQAAQTMGLEIDIIDPDPQAPATGIARQHIVAPLDDAAALSQLAAQTDVLTIEIESVGIEQLQALAAEGHTIYPDPDELALLVNKLHQKRTLQQLGLPTSRFVELPRPSRKAVQAFGLPCVQKLQRGGYDGRGVQILRSASDLDQLLDGPSLLEAFVPCRAELAVVVARSIDGKVASYAPTELIFDSQLNVLDALVAPARLPDAICQAARALAEETISRVDAIGVHAVELFLSTDDTLLVNEISPRVHNSGHHSIEACTTSQFEQQLRIVTGRALGSTAQQHPAAMVNILGEPGSSGPTHVDGLDAVSHMPGVHVHLYGKQSSRPGRKMGHITALDPDPDQALARARQARGLIRVRGEH